MVEKIFLLEEKQQKRVDTLRKKQEEEKKEEIEHIDFQSMDFEDLLSPMISSVNYDLGMRNFTSPVLVLQDVLNVKKIKLVQKEEKQKAISILLTKLKNKKSISGAYVRLSIFDKTFTSYKESLRKTTTGVHVQHVLSKKTEEKIIDLYIAIFEQQLSYYFDFISFDDYAKNYIPLALKLSFIPGSRYSKIRKQEIFDFILDRICPKLTDKSFFYSLLKEHYQKEQLTFAQPKNLGDIKWTKSYSFLLSKQQQKEVVEYFIPICMDMIHYYTSKSERETDEDPILLLNDLYSLKKDLEFLHDLQKGMIEDELK